MQIVSVDKGTFKDPKEWSEKEARINLARSPTQTNPKEFVYRVLVAKLALY